MRNTFIRIKMQSENQWFGVGVEHNKSKIETTNAGAEF